MKSDESNRKLSGQQQRVLKLLFKFRFVSAGLLSMVMGIDRMGVYRALERLVGEGLVTKVYKEEWRIDRRPAYYYLNKSGVTTVRKLMGAKESVVHALYKNGELSSDFVRHSLTLMKCYVAIKKYLPEGTDMFSKTEINRFEQFPRSRPDLYIRTPGGKEAIVVIVDDQPKYIVRKRFDEILAHSEREGWTTDTYPRICFILRDTAAKNSFLYTTRKKLDNMAIDDDELAVRAASIESFDELVSLPWSSPFKPKQLTELFD